MARELLEAVFIEGKDPEAIIAERGWKPVSDPAALRGVLERLVAAHPEEAERVRAGDDAPRERFIGLAIKETGGQADPVVLREALRDLLPSEALRVFLPEAAKGAFRADEVGWDGPARISAWPEPRTGAGFAERWAGALVAVAKAARKETPRGIVALPPGPWTAALSAFIGWALADAPLPIALVADPVPEDDDGQGGSEETWRSDVARAAARASNGGNGVVLYRDGAEFPVTGPSLAPGAWEADEEIIASLLARCSRETLCVPALPGSLDMSLRLAESQGARIIVMEFPDPAFLSRDPFPRDLHPSLAPLRKRGILAVAAFRRPGAAAPSAGLKEACAREGLLLGAIHVADTAFGWIMAAGLEAEDRDELRAMLSDTP